MDSLISSSAAQIGLPVDLLRIAICLVASFPLGSLVKRIPPKYAAGKDAVIAGCGIFFLAGVFQLKRGIFTLLLSSTVTYVLGFAWPNRWFMPWANFFAIMGLMLVTHTREQMGGSDYVNEIGISGSQMILVQKLTAYAWDVYDGTRPAEQLSAFQKEARITQRPSPLRFLSWVFFFPTILTGPACGLREYSAWVDLSMFAQVEKDSANKAGGVVVKRKVRIPRSGYIEVLKLFEGLVWVTIMTQCTAFAQNLEFFKQPWYTGAPFLGRVVALYAVGLAFRTKYYAAWAVSEAACMHAGISYNGINPDTGKIRWDRMRNVKAASLELSQNFHLVFANWNIVTSKWLRHYVYLRVTPKGKKPGASATFITFVVSALWHGTRPGYYLTFVTAAIYQTFGRVYRHKLRPLFVGTAYKLPYDILTWVVTQLALGYVAMPFIELNIRPALAVWTTVYFYVHVGLGLSWLLLLGPLSKYVNPVLKTLAHDIASSD